MYILNLYNVTGQLYLNFEMWLIHKIEYYLGKKFWHIPQHGGTLKTLVDISQTEKDTCYMISLT